MQTDRQTKCPKGRRYEKQSQPLRYKEKTALFVYPTAWPVPTISVT